MATRVLVTGGFGFLGSHLLERLLEEGACVHVVDDLSSTTIDVPSFASSLEGRLGMLTYDLESVADWSSRRRRGEVYGSASQRVYDEIYHLASIVGPVGVLPHAGQIVGRIVEDAYLAIDLARQSGAKLCYVSTSEVYGGGRSGACAESDPRVIPAQVTARLEYAVAKIAAETAIINTARATGDLSAAIVRPFNVAGPRQSAAGGFVLPRFARQALSGQPLTVYGSGGAIRAFTHAQDVADGLVRATRAARPGLGAAVYNLGRAANRTTILDLARRVLAEVGGPSRITHVDPQSLHGAAFAEAGDKFPDDDLATRDLGWHPRRGLDEIVRDAVAWERARQAQDAGSPGADRATETAEATGQRGGVDVDSRR